MRYFIDLFSPETAGAFSKSDMSISGFRISRKTYVENQNIGRGDKFICYCTKIQRFIGVLEILGNPFFDSKPIFVNDNDPFVLRFNVKPIVWLPLEKGIPIHDRSIWSSLSFTKKLNADSNQWTYMVFSSPRLWPKSDCEIIEKRLLKQSRELIDFPFSESEEKKVKISKIRLNNKSEITVTIPDDDKGLNESGVISSVTKEIRESIKVQALLSEIGEKLGFKIWLPKSDRNKVLELWKPESDSLLDELPLVFDETTLKTIRNIDVLWIRRRSIVRAFEVEDTTSIYSGILRMADLLSLQPMLDIKIHIVAPSYRKDSVFDQITRPVFAVMEKGPLSEICTYIPYDSVYEIAKEKRLEDMKDTIVDNFIEYANE